MLRHDSWRPTRSIPGSYDWLPPTSHPSPHVNTARVVSGARTVQAAATFAPSLLRQRGLSNLAKQELGLGHKCRGGQSLQQPLRTKSCDPKKIHMHNFYE